MKHGIVVTRLAALIGVGMPLRALAGTLTLHNIAVVIDEQTHTWTYAGDNGTGGG